MKAKRVLFILGLTDMKGKKKNAKQNPNHIRLHLFNLKIEISEWKRNLSKT